MIQRNKAFWTTQMGYSNGLTRLQAYHYMSIKLKISFTNIQICQQAEKENDCTVETTSLDTIFNKLN